MLMEEVRILAATEASKERLRWHPCTDFLREFAEEHDLHVFHSAAETLVESFQVTYASYDYDECRNASFSAVVLFSLPSGEFEIHYEYRRHSHAMPGSNITFTLMFAEKAAKPERVLKYELHTPHAYPKMMYEEVNEEEDKQEICCDDGFSSMLDAFSFTNMDIVEVIHFILAFPFHEEEWMIDDRIVELLMSE